MNIDLSYIVPIELSDKEDPNIDPYSIPLNIGGMSVKHGYVKSKHIIVPKKELANIVKTLKEGVDGIEAYILKDHGYKGDAMFAPMKSVDLLVGRITGATHKKDEGKVFYTGRIEDKDTAFKLRRKLVTSSSAGLSAKSAYCSICGKEFGDESCNHIMGKQYPDEKLHESVEEYLGEMEGVPTAALVPRNLIAREQSIVLFPAIEGATATPMGLNFSQESEKFIDQIEKEKESRLKMKDLDASELVNSLEKVLKGESIIEKLSLDSTEIIEKLEKLEGFNKDSLKQLSSEINMSEVEVQLKAQLDAITKELTDSKKEINDGKEREKTKDEIIVKYKKDEEARHAEWRRATEKEAADLRKERSFAEKDFSKISDEVLLSEVSLLKEISVANKLQGQAGGLSEAEEHAKAKADLKKKIFG